ncbi:MAG: methyltransferase domain-containing protein [Anaerolineae bacterium]|nr:methyltransferase domain-containing protein [Anaerolineae bacterium]
MAGLAGLEGAHVVGWGMGLLLLGVLGFAAYWALVLSEGAYFGPRVVAWLYDRTAARYDRIKNTQPSDDARYLARPLLLALEAVPDPLVLDVGTGTGRVPAALLAEEDFCGRVLGVDRSPGMLGQASCKPGVVSERCGLVLGDAGSLPVGDARFDAVICLEVLEFTACPQEVLRELTRALKPGGVLLISNRVGLDALWYPGRLCGRGRLEAALRLLGLEVVETETWQTYYDLIWARKAPSAGLDRAGTQRG